MHKNFSTALLLLALVVAQCGPCLAKEAWSEMSVANMSHSFWGPRAARMPSADFVGAVTAASLRVIDGLGSERRLAVLSIASEFTFTGEGMWQLFLANLKNITFAHRNGTQDHLAAHLVATVMTLPNGTADNCNRLSQPYGARCTTITCPIFTSDNYHYKSPPFYALSFAKVLTIIDALTLNVDVFFLDADQVFFRNPLPYMLARPTIDILVSGDCQNRGDDVPLDRFPPVGSNIGVLHFRSKPMVLRAVLGWLGFLNSRAQINAPVLDQSTFGELMEGISATMGAKVMSVGMLRGETFGYKCMGSCGCDSSKVPLGARGSSPARTADGMCPKEFVREWYGFHVPCDGDMNQKARSMAAMVSMYEKLVGPINSLSSPMPTAT